jgi:phage baseplate assembly protein W
MWEPRITVVQVDAQPDRHAANRLLVDIKYIVKSTGDPRSLVFPYYLIPEETT